MINSIKGFFEINIYTASKDPFVTGSSDFTIYINKSMISVYFVPKTILSLKKERVFLKEAVKQVLGVQFFPLACLG